MVFWWKTFIVTGTNWNRTNHKISKNFWQTEENKRKKNEMKRSHHIWYTCESQTYVFAQYTKCTCYWFELPFFNIFLLFMFVFCFKIQRFLVLCVFSSIYFAFSVYVISQNFRFHKIPATKVTNKKKRNNVNKVSLWSLFQIIKKKHSKIFSTETSE